MTTLMTPTAGCVYNFTFKSGYNVFDGIYKVSKIMTFDEYVDDGGDIDTDFFSPNDKSEELNNELSNVQTSKILKLSHPSDDDLEPIFVPMYYLECTPDFNVKEYYNLGIVANIGITESVEDVDFIRSNITEAIESAIGVEPDPTLVIINTKWMTESDYQKIVAERDQNKINTRNYYSENLKLEDRLSRANTKINEYEKLIINLQHQVDKLKLVLENK